MRKLATITLALTMALGVPQRTPAPKGISAPQRAPAVPHFDYTPHIGTAKLDNDVFDQQRQNPYFRLPQELYVPDHAQDKKPYHLPFEVEP